MYWIRITSTLLFLPLLSFFTPSSVLASGCLDCHTDAAKIKELYTPPTVEFKVDEGES
ncbi:hypothetical protein GO013_10435 [Pseudodesulfovibrio sp. JC047]|uniref:hypothetical protein n=1 Tax=Pseudodesulfovibrio sp. JC047 TaxID=2683199 RepID=UPI0013D583BA|nr:hypothetical protein [Pseudodesulfovibrio sp. JC047]NDV19837.1 hypothetical protein [Pseudodesulfovibrio sp. JC047]